MEPFVPHKFFISHFFCINKKKIRIISAFFLSHSSNFYILCIRTLCSPPNPQKTGPALLGQFSFIKKPKFAKKAKYCTQSVHLVRLSHGQKKLLFCRDFRLLLNLGSL